MSGFGYDGPKPQRQHELSIAGGNVNLSGARNVSFFRTLILPLHLKVLREILPTIGVANKTHRHFLPRDRRCERQRYPVAFGQQHRGPLIIPDPAWIAIAAIAEVGREQSI